MLLAQAEWRLGIAKRLAAVIPDDRDASRVVHPLPDILRARIFAIACGYEDADDLDRLRGDPAFKLACGRLPDTGRDLCSQPTVSRWENAPNLREIVRLMRVMIDLYCASYAVPPDVVTLDIDDRWMSFTAISSSRYSTPVTMSAVSRRSMSTTRRRAGQSPCCCALARRPRAQRCAVTCVVSSVASAGTGPRPGSPSVATAITAARRSWSGATRIGSTSSSACPATLCSTGWLMKRPTTFAPAARSTRNPVYAASLRQVPGEILEHRPPHLRPH